MTCPACCSSHVAYRGDGSQECGNCGHIDPWVHPVAPRSRLHAAVVVAGTIAIFNVLYWWPRC